MFACVCTFFVALLVLEFDEKRSKHKEILELGSI